MLLPTLLFLAVTPTIAAIPVYEALPIRLPLPTAQGIRHSLDDDGWRFDHVELRRFAKGSSVPNDPEPFLDLDLNNRSGASIAWKVLMRDGTTVPDCVLTFSCKSNQVKELEVTAGISLLPQLSDPSVIGHCLAEGTIKIRPTKEWSGVKVPMKFYRLVQFEKNKHIVTISVKSAKAKLSIKNPELNLP